MFAFFLIMFSHLVWFPFFTSKGPISHQFGLSNMGGCQELCRWDELRDMGGRGLNLWLLMPPDHLIIHPPLFGIPDVWCKQSILEISSDFLSSRFLFYSISSWQSVEWKLDLDLILKQSACHVMWATKKPSYFPLYWLFNRYPYNNSL